MSGVRGHTLQTLLERVREQPGERPFLGVGDELATGTDFAHQVERLARGLVARGFRPGDRLAVHVHRCPEEAVAILAAAVAGGIAVPVNPKLKDDQVAHVLADSEPWAVVASATKLAMLRDPQRVLGGRRLFHADAKPLRGLESEALGACGQDGNSLPALEPRQPAVLLYTSGSTGLAKGIVQDHRNLVDGARIVGGYLGLSPADHVLAVLPFSFDYGLNQLLGAMYHGARVTAADWIGLGELAHLLRTVRPTGLAGVPSLWHEVCRGVRTGQLTAADGSSLRYVTNSGGRLAVEDIRTLRATWPAMDVHSMYGLTEAFRSATLPPAEVDRHPESFGRAIPEVELLIVDPRTGAVLEGPAEGELVHAGALVAHGYWRRPEATAQRFRPDPRGLPGTVVHSGDLVRRDAAGLLHFVARSDRMLKVSGHRISPDEVAQALDGLPGAGEVAVFGLPGGPDGDRIVLCVAGTDPTLEARALRQCRSRLPAYMVPDRVCVLPELPHNANGKVDVVVLAQRMAPCTDNT